MSDRTARRRLSRARAGGRVRVHVVLLAERGKGALSVWNSAQARTEDVGSVQHKGITFRKRKAPLRSASTVNRYAWSSPSTSSRSGSYEFRSGGSHWRTLHQRRCCLRQRGGGGCLTALTQVMTVEAMTQALATSFPSAAVALNQKAFKSGYD